MAGLFPDHHDYPHGRIRVLYFVANGFCEMGDSILDLRSGHFALWTISNQNNQDLFSTERQERWDLRSK
jgi:hypothetical protein